MSRKNKAATKNTSNDKENADDDISKNYISLSIAEYQMHFEKNREKSFDNWPTDSKSKCNPSTLAAAGFYHIPTSESPDAVRCFICYKELDGWESEDCPWSEHKKHSSHCAFLALKKPLLQLSIDEFLELECKRVKCKVEKQFHAKKALLHEQAAHVRSELMKL